MPAASPLGTEQGMPHWLSESFCLELSTSLALALFHIGIFLSVRCGTVGASCSFKL